MGHPVTLTKDAVTLYDLHTDQARNLSLRDGEEDLILARELGDSLREYDTTDRNGRPLRVVLQLPADHEDPAGIYEFAS
jgi:hypothetical protein